MNLKRYSLILGLAFIAALTLSACGGSAAVSNPSAQATPNGSSSSANPPAQSNSPAAPALGGEAPAAGEAGGVEAALVVYNDAAQHFTIAHPGNWSQDPSVTSGVKFKGGDEIMQLQFVTLKGGDAMAYARQDTTALAAAYPGFKLIGIAASTDMSNTIIQGFEADGKSAVTGKTYRARGDRYYMTLPDGRLALLTIVGPTSNYDPQGVRDIALTLKVTR